LHSQIIHREAALLERGRKPFDELDKPLVSELNSSTVQPDRRHTSRNRSTRQRLGGYEPSARRKVREAIQRMSGAFAGYPAGW